MKGKSADSKLLAATRPSTVAAGSAAMLGASWIMHSAHAGPAWPLMFTATVDGIAYVGVSRKAGRKDPHRGHRLAARATVAATAAGGWLTLATVAGPAAGPHHAVTLAWAAGTLIGITTLHRMESVRAAKRARQARREWNRIAHKWGLDGTHMVKYEPTRLGEWYEIDVAQAGKRGSQVAGRGLAEDIAAHHHLPVERVQVREGAIAGRVTVSVRHLNPWARPIPHPLFDPDPGHLVLDYPATIRKPVTVGQNPETGEPLTLPLWDQGGAKNIFFIGKREAAKTTMLNNIRERVTAAPDAILWDINLSKASENFEWGPLCYLSAHGPDQRDKAIHILELACQMIDLAPFIKRDQATIQPTSKWPLIVLVVDEVDALAKIPGASRRLSHIATKARSEAITYVFAGQRGINTWLGSVDVRTQLDTVGVGKVHNLSEATKVLADHWVPWLPNMATYGEGNPGVWAFLSDHGCQTGWGFKLDDYDDIREIVAARHGWGGLDGPQLAPAMAARLGDLFTGLRENQLATYYPDAPRRPPPVPGTVPDDVGELSPDGGAVATLTDDSASLIGSLDREWEATMPDDLRARLAELDKKNRKTRETLDGPVPEAPSREGLEAYARAQWDALYARTKIPPETLPRLLEMLTGEGTTNGAVAAAFRVTPYTARTWLGALRQQHLARVTGTGRASRWITDTPPPGKES